MISFSFPLCDTGCVNISTIPPANESLGIEGLSCLLGDIQEGVSRARISGWAAQRFCEVRGTALHGLFAAHAFHCLGMITLSMYFSHILLYQMLTLWESWTATPVKSECTGQSPTLSEQSL